MVSHPFFFFFSSVISVEYDKLVCWRRYYVKPFLLRYEDSEAPPQNTSPSKANWNLWVTLFFPNEKWAEVSPVLCVLLCSEWKTTATTKTSFVAFIFVRCDLPWKLSYAFIVFTLKSITGTVFVSLNLSQRKWLQGSCFFYFCSLTLFQSQKWQP